MQVMIQTTRPDVHNDSHLLIIDKSNTLRYTVPQLSFELLQSFPVEEKQGTHATLQFIHLASITRSITFLLSDDRTMAIMVSKNWSACEQWSFLQTER